MQDIRTFQNRKYDKFKINKKIYIHEKDSMCFVSIPKSILKNTLMYVKLSCWIHAWYGPKIVYSNFYLLLLELYFYHLGIKINYIFEN